MVTSQGFAAETFLREVLGAQNIRIKGDEITHACLFIQHSNDHKEPGASLNAEKLLYNCWKCGSGGTLLWLTESVLDIGSAKARALIKEYFDSDEIHEETRLQMAEQAWAKSPVETMPRYSLKMLEGWKCYTQYMDERGISRDVQQEMMTGLNTHNVDEVTVNGEKVQIVQPRVVIPHMFLKTLRGWTMRLVDKRQVGNKYKHTGQFPKAVTLYNYDKVRGYSEVIVVESPMSVLKLKTLGFDNVVATFGAEVNEGQVDLLKYFDQVTLFPDGDRAGYRSLRNVGIRGEVEGLIDNLGRKTRVFVVDHGRKETSLIEPVNGMSWDENDGFNQADAADYNEEQIRELIQNKVPARGWKWEGENAIRKVHAYKVGLGAEGAWD